MLSGELRRRVLTPFWCTSPETKSWSNAKGPAALVTADVQEYPEVGLFNLMWLMLDTKYGEKRTAADHVISNYVVTDLQKQTINGAKLKDLAAFYSLNDFALLASHSSFPGKLNVLNSLMAKGLTVS